MGLTQKVVALVVVGSALVFVGFAFVGMWSLKHSTDRILQERLVLAQMAAESVDRYNSEVIQQLNRVGQLALEPMTQGDSASMDAVLKSSQALAISDFKEMFLLDGSAKVIAATPSMSSKVGTSLLDFADVNRVLSSGQPLISGVVPCIDDGSPAVVYAVPIKRDGGATVGVLFGDMHLKSSPVDGFIRTIKLGKTGYAQVVDGHGELIASTQPEEVFGKSDHGDRFVALIEAKRSIVSTCHNCHDPGAEGQKTKRADVMAFAPLSTASWGVAVRQAQEEALSPTRSLEQGMVIVGLLSLAVSLPLAAIIAGRTMRPVKVLTIASRRMANGDLNTQVPHMGEDEVGILAQNFEQMRRSLRESHDELEQRSQEAEALYDISMEISRLLDTDKILSSVVEKARVLLSADVALLLLWDEQGETYVKETSGAITKAMSQVKLASGQGFTGVILKQGLPVATADYLEDGTFMHDKSVDDVIAQERLHAHLGVPLKVGHQVLGALVVGRRYVKAFSPHETSLLERLANQAAIAINNAYLYEEVRRKEELRGQLLDKVISAQEEERKRIARELHDEPAQIFTALAMQLEAMATQLPQSQVDIKERLQRQQALAAHALETIRKLMSDLRPTALDDLGLVPAIRQYAESRLGEEGVRINLRATNMPARLPGRVETVVFRIMQEAVNNVYKHAAAHNVTISLRYENNTVKATVQDDGRGFDADALARSGYKGAGLGLLGIDERVSLIGGSLIIESEPGKGTELHIEVPLPQGGVDDNQRS
ncbi:MAG: GAF domain-containing protein [Chloroflexi bacterium]|nr:GAF domain-containing protein [Chloroflexota bacterium]